MIEELDMNNLGEIADIEIDNWGIVKEPKNDKTIIIDADTIAYIICKEMEYEMFGEWNLPLSHSFSMFNNKLDYILEKVGGKRENTELHFTGSRYSFRYKLLLDAFPKDETKWYKAKRKDRRAPTDLGELKKLACNMEDIKLGVIHQEWEADDMVVTRKLELGDDAILCGIDKDVLLNTPGHHFNYYASNKYKIPMQWVDVNEQEAMWHVHYQTIIGDKSDNVPGLIGVGPVKASKFLDKDMTEGEMWDAVIAAYNTHCDYGDPVEMAILNRRLVCMRQLVKNDKGEYDVKLWQPNGK